MVGIFTKSHKDKLDVSEQFHVIKDSVLRGFLISFADTIDEKARKEIVATYANQELASAYRAWRRFNDLYDNGFTKRGTMREIVRVPAGHVYEFLRAFFEPMYGEKWMQNRKALRHPLVRHWWVVSKI